MVDAVVSKSQFIRWLQVASTMKTIGESIGEFFHWVSPGRKFVYYLDEGSSEDRGRLLKFTDLNTSTLCRVFTSC